MYTSGFSYFPLSWDVLIRLINLWIFGLSDIELFPVILGCSH